MTRTSRRLQGVGFLHSLEAQRHVLQRDQALDVVLHRLPPGARPGGRDGISGGDEERLYRLRLHLEVVRLDGVDNARRRVELLGQVGADQGVRAVHFVIDGLADVVQQPGAPADVHVGP